MTVIEANFAPNQISAKLPCVAWVQAFTAKEINDRWAGPRGRRGQLRWVGRHGNRLIDGLGRGRHREISWFQIQTFWQPSKNTFLGWLKLARWVIQDLRLRQVMVTGGRWRRTVVQIVIGRVKNAFENW